MRRGLLTALALLAAAVGVSACGSASTSVNDTPEIEQGAQLFAQRCSGCHQFDVVGAEGSALKVRDRERVDGPNFNVRCPATRTDPASGQRTCDRGEAAKENILYAIRNGGFSGGIMPENIVVGEEAEAIAEFLAKYAGEGGGRDSSESR